MREEWNDSPHIGKWQIELYPASKSSVMQRYLDKASAADQLIRSN